MMHVVDHFHSYRIRRAVRVHFRIDGDGLRDTCNISRAPFTSDRPEILSVFIQHEHGCSEQAGDDHATDRSFGSDLAQAHPTS